MWGSLLAFVVLLVTIISFDVYLTVEKGWNLLDPDGEAVALVDRIAPHDLHDELTADFERRGWRRSVAVGVWLTALGTFFSIPAFLAGLLGLLVGTAFPLPDLLLAAVVSFDAATRTEYETGSFDLEDRVYPAVGAATSSLTGAVLVLIVAFGVLLSVQILVSALHLSVSVTSTQLWTDSAVARWNAFGLVTVLLTVAVYDFWVWVRTLDRLPALAGSDDESGGATSNRPAYPLGLTVPPTAALVALVPFIPLVGRGPTQHLVLTVLWPVLLTGLGLAALASLSTSDAVSNAERWLVVGALLVQIVGWTVVVHGGRLAEVATDSLLLFSLAIVPLLASLPDIVRYATRYDDARRYATGLYLSYLATVAAIVSLTTSGPTAVAIRLFALGVLLGGVLLLVGEFVFPD